MDKFTNNEGAGLVLDMIKTIQDNKQYLSDVDGAIGDGDHGINMNKGFTLCEGELAKNPANLTTGLKTLSKILMTQIGGSMGPLYGTFFRAMARVSGDNEYIDAALFGKMLEAARDSVASIGNAKVGDKTLMDTLVPAVEAYMNTLAETDDFAKALVEMKAAAAKGRDSTKDLVAKLGRASRLGERSRGVLDAGAVSCCLLLTAMADTILSMQ